MTSAYDYARIERAIHYLERHAREQPSLADAARAVALSPFHFQRLFRRWAGVSPKRFLQYLTVEHAKTALLEGRSVLAATYEAGLSGPGRLHDLFVAVDAMTPGEFKERGGDLVIRYGVHPSPFGDCVIATTHRGICGLEFVADGAPREATARLRRRWTRAELREEPEATVRYAERIFHTPAAVAPLTLHLKGTNFQLKVWEALLRVPPGSAVTYEDLGRAAGRPGAARAVGSAVGANPVAYVIPCHRVLRKTGALGDYRWGVARKRAMLGWEAAQRETRPGLAASTVS